MRTNGQPYKVCTEDVFNLPLIPLLVPLSEESLPQLTFVVYISQGLLTILQDHPATRCKYVPWSCDMRSLMMLEAGWTVGL